VLSFEDKKICKRINMMMARVQLGM
jgi:hypothetical protein